MFDERIPATGQMNGGSTFDHEVDVLVVGSGAGGMVTALTARAEGLAPLIIESSRFWGGSSARSGGGAWVPNAPALLREGQRDDPQRIIDYMLAIAGDRVPRERIERYVEAAPEMMAFLESREPVPGRRLLLDPRVLGLRARQGRQSARPRRLGAADRPPPARG